MTDKKHKQHEPKEEQATETPVEATAEQPQVDVVELMKRLDEAEAQAAEHRADLQRERAEFVNYKNRIARDQETSRSNMKGDILQKVLPVLDDLERALQNRPVDEAWASGIELIARKFQSVLESEGVKRIEAEGQPFDPNFHEAISHEPNDEVESGHIIAVVRNGYTLGERVIRPALVRVAQ